MSTVAYRTQHRAGHYVWIEALGQYIATGESGTGEIIYSGRDITARVAAEQALAESQARLRAVTDHIPALIAQVDKDERYRFANAYFERVLHIDPNQMLGRTLREVRGEKVYGDMRPHIAAALRGETVRFEGVADIDGQPLHYLSEFVPDRDNDGSVRGFYALTFDITSQKQAELALARLARFDSMTGVANRRHFDEQLALALVRSHADAQPITLLYLDIDHFKRINDSHGHNIGDEVITEFARRLLACVRSDDLVARLGGDEFVVLIHNASTPATAETIATKLISTMLAPIITSVGAVQATTSIGIAFCAEAIDALSLIALADQALYAAKSNGRGQYRLVVTGAIVPAKPDEDGTEAGRRTPPLRTLQP